MSNDSNISKVKLYGQPNSPEAYEIRDFLKRSVVEFDWIELTCDEDCDRELGFASLEELRLPVVELVDGTQLFSPQLILKRLALN
jgi:thioredoxin reductase (NADPH)